MERSHKTALALVLIIIVPLLIVGGAYLFFVRYGVLHPNGNTNTSTAGKKDDWAYTGPENSGMFGGIQKNIQQLGTAAPSAESLGYSTGGAKDVNNFRENIKNDYLPLETDITYEGLFYDYYFDMGSQKTCSKLFCPSYSYAITKDPLSKKDEYYMAVGLNSGIQEKDFQRKKLNLVVVLDISGSMGSSFDSYYYDDPMNVNGAQEEAKSKIEVARESVVALLSHLNTDDRFGMVLYDDVSYLAKPIRRVGDTDMEALKKHILEINENGGTNMEAGLKEGTDLFDEYLKANQDEYENRIIFLTDAMPNTGDFSEEGLLGMTQKNADAKLYTTFIGIGVDFNTELVSSITQIRGANYYSVHSSSEFQKRMDEQFEYMVTPLVFNLKLNLTADGYEIQKVYGSPEADEATGEIMKVNTLFPSPTEDGATKGGLVLLQLKKTKDDAALELAVSYEDRLGKKDGDSQTVILSDKKSEYFENKGIEKGILLARYAKLVKDWIIDERAHYTPDQPVIYYKPIVSGETGIIIPPDEWPSGLTEWERTSLPLHVSDEYKQSFADFLESFTAEKNTLADTTLDKEVDILTLLKDFQDKE